MKCFLLLFLPYISSIFGSLSSLYIHDVVTSFHLTLGHYLKG